MPPEENRVEGRSLLADTKQCQMITDLNCMPRGLMRRERRMAGTGVGRACVVTLPHRGVRIFASRLPSPVFFIHVFDSRQFASLGRWSLCVPPLFGVF